MNWTVIIILGILMLALLFLWWRVTLKMKDLENRIKNDYHKARNGKGDIEIDEKMK